MGVGISVGGTDVIKVMIGDGRVAFGEAVAWMQAEKNTKKGNRNTALDMRRIVPAKIAKKLA